MSLSMTEANAALDRGDKITLPGSEAYWYKEGCVLKRANKVTRQVWGMVGAMPWKNNWEIYIPEPEKITYSEAVLICAKEPGTRMRWHEWHVNQRFEFSGGCMTYFVQHRPATIEYPRITNDMATEKGWIITRPADGGSI